MNIFCINIRSLGNKFEELKIYLNKDNVVYDIVVVTETWVKRANVDMYNIAGYCSYHSTRDIRDGGGVSVWVHTKYTSHNIYEHNDIHNNIILIGIKELNFKVMAVYNTYNNTFFEKFDELLTLYDKCYVIGDMNIDLLVNNSIKQNYSDIINSNGLHVLNKIEHLYSTRKTLNTNTIIDHILTDITNRAYTLTLNSHCFTDHESLTLQINTTKPIIKNRTITKTHTNFNQFRYNYNADPRETSNYTQLHLKITKHINDSTCNSIKNITYKNKILYMNNELRYLIKKRDSLYVRHKKYSNNQLIKNLFISARNIVTNKLRAARKKYEMNRVNEAGVDKRKLWLVLNSCLFNRERNNNSNFPTCMLINNMNVSEPLTIANHFNNAFVYADQRNSNLNTITFDLNSRFRAHNSFTFNSITTDYILNIIKNLKENTSPGYDNITVKLLKYLVPDHTSSFVKIINNIILTSKYPDELKISKIIPIHKKGSRDDPLNYRPIAIIPTFSKIIEATLYTQFLNFLLNTNFFHPDQYGFIPKSGTEIATVNLMQGINNSIDKNNYTSAIFIDLKKAFDNINRPLFIKKLCSMNVSNGVVLIFISFLTSRKQYTVINNVSSELKPSETGVPQGSKLAALLFLIFINDIFKCNFLGTMQLYADDIVIYYSCKTIDALKNEMQHDLDLLKTYITENLLTINIKKTNYIIFKNRQDIQNNIILKYDSSIISRVTEVKYLGLIINNKLNWTSHIDQIKTKIGCLIGALRQARHFLPKCSQIKIYFAHIYSHLNYLSPIWGNAPLYKIKELCILQNKAMKIILKKPRLTTSSSLYNAQFLSLNNLLIYNQTLLIHKMKNNIIRHNISLSLIHEIHQYSTRNRNNIYLGMVRTNSGRKSTMYQAIKQYNVLPNELKDDTNIISFKKRLKNYIVCQGAANNIYSHNHA